MDLYFHSVESGNHNATSSFKSLKIFIFVNNRCLQYLSYRINYASTKNYLIKFSDIFRLFMLESVYKFFIPTSHELQNKLANPCPDELFASIFHSFKSRIANTISSYKCLKIFIFIKKINYLQYGIMGLTMHLPKTIR